MRPLTWDQMASCEGPWPFDERGLPLGDPGLEVKVKPELVFISSTEQKGIKVMTETSSATVKVKVNGNYRVVVGKPYTGGQVLDAPDDEQTRLWIRAGWVTPVAAAKREKA